jgi:hypothetical protein
MVTNLQSIISSQVKDIEEMRARINALEGEREVEVSFSFRLCVSLAFVFTLTKAKVTWIPNSNDHPKWN